MTGKEKTESLRLIVGLGNPEKKYDETYHNIGFRFIDKLAQKIGIEVRKSKYKSLIGEGKFDFGKGAEKVILAKPLTYMNLSGEAVALLKNKYKAKADEVWIILDDVDLPVGKFRYRENGSAGTHNGLKNIILNLKDENFKRIRIGIGKDEKMDLADYVLSRISKENAEKIDSAIEDAADFICSFC